MSSKVGRLLEREHELEQVAAALDRARDGSGALISVAGPAGIGKTRLVRAARLEAEERCFLALTGRGTELEREYSFGVVRQLLEPAVRSRTEQERRDLFDGAAGLAAPVVFPESAVADLAPDPAFGLLHGLFWLCSNLAARRPLLLAIDDAHWADDASIRFFSFLAQRVEELPILMFVTVRSPDGDDRAIGDGPVTEHLSLSPLSGAGVAAFLRAHTTATVDEAFVAACHESTGGNPLLLTHLVRGLVEQQVPFTAAGVGSVDALGPDAVSAAVQRRLLGLEPRAVALARAASVLGDDTPLVVAAELAGLGEAEAAEAAAMLVRAGVLEDSRPLRFEHPIVRGAVEAAMPAGDRTMLHRRAANLLARRPGSEDEVALHLLHVEPSGEGWVVSELAAAARRAADHGAPGVAVPMLLRALAEPPEVSLRPGLLLDLGRAETALARHDAAEHLVEAHRLSTDPLERARAALALAWSASMPPGDVDIDRLVDDAIDAASPVDAELALELEAVRGAIRGLDPALASQGGRGLERFADLEGRTPAECALLAHLAHHRMDAGESAESASEPAERALADAGILRAGLDAPWLLPAILVLRCADRIESVLGTLDGLLKAARARGSVHTFSLASALRASVLLRSGDIREAAADARAAFDALSTGSWAKLPALGVLVEVLVETGELREATDLLVGAGADGDLPPIRPATVLLLARAALAFERGEPGIALADFERARARLAGYTGHRSPVGIEGRAGAALARRALGDESGARNEADLAVEIARRWGTPGAVGIALRARALTASGVEQLELLRDAVAALERSPRRLEHARALVDLGAALRRSGERVAARDPLKQALGLAHECGGLAVEARAEVELTATGARVRRHAQTGIDALTPSERRIVDRAAAGESNREIAQALFVTVKTIEMHLSHAYRKLGISSRNELARL